AAIPGYKIGVVWRGSLVPTADRRSASLDQFKPLAEIGGVRLISLQVDAKAEEMQAADFPVLDLSDRLDKSGAFLDTAALMKCLDLVVTVDTATAHLAGALAVPVWVLLATVPDWRFMLERSDSPWYPTMRLFRQRAQGDWSTVLVRVAGEISALSAA